MPPAALAARIEAIEDRLAGTDADRRAATTCAAELRAGGRRPRAQPLWFRPQLMMPRAVQAAAGVAGSIVSASHATVGLSIAAAALVVALLAAAQVAVIRPLASRRATQNVIAPPPAADDRVLLVLA